MYAEAAGEIKRAKRFLVLSHVNPEGDAVGSLIGLALGLRSIGKEAVAYLEDEVPRVFSFLPGADTVVHDLEGEAPFDATFAVDCGQVERLGARFSGFKRRGRLINIDHHATNDRFGDVNIVAPDVSAAGEMVFDLLRSAGIRITRDIAVNLYVAIHTDTGSFRYSSATPDAFRKAGELVALGVDPWEVASLVYENHPAEKYRLLALVLSTLDVRDTGGFKTAALDVTLDMMKRTGAGREHADGFVNHARAIEGVDVGVLFREQAPGEYKVSMRSRGRVDVADIAMRFGGGGHRNAAGFNMKGRPGEIKEAVFSAIGGVSGGLGHDKGERESESHGRCGGY